MLKNNYSIKQQGLVSRRGFALRGSTFDRNDYFEMTVDTTNTERVGSSPSTDYDIPLQNLGFYNCTAIDKDTNQVLRVITDPSHKRVSFAVGGVKTIQIRGVFRGIITGNGGLDNPKLIGIKWGQFQALNFSNVQDCPNLVSVSGILDLSLTNVFAFFFKDTPNLLDIQDLNKYDVSGITSFTNEIFTRCGFNTFHGDWDTSQWIAKFRLYTQAINYNQSDNHDNSLAQNFGEYLFGASSYNQPVDISMPSAVAAGLFMRDCISQAQNVILTNTQNVTAFNSAFQNMPSMFAAGATISVDSFAGATNLTNLFTLTKLTTANIDAFLNQWVNTISTATGQPMANFTTDLGGSVPSAQGLADINTLTSTRGWTITGIGS